MNCCSKHTPIAVALAVAISTSVTVALMSVSRAGAQDSAKKDGAQAEQPAAPQLTPEEAAALGAWAKYAEVGPEQQWLAKWVGSWDCKVEFWMVPGAPATTSSGSCTYETVYGGRFLKQDYKGSMGEGMEFEGTGFVCFDNARQRFLHIWFDSYSSGWSSGVGTGGAATGRIDWESVEPNITEGGAKTARGVQTLVDDNTLILENYEKTADGERLMMRLTFTRAAGSR